MIDGVRYEAQSDQARALGAVSADQIATIEVLKGGAAERRGVSGGRGLIIVTLKKSSAPRS
ncbi:MAG: hypothetical protein ACREON_08770 [Gemmatimonadaceae bacterium]